MNCRQIRRYLSDYIERGLEKAIHKEIEGHINGCKRCSQETFEFKGLLNIAGRMAKIKASADFEEKLKKRIARDTISQRRRLPKPGILVDIFRTGALRRPVAIVSLMILLLLLLKVNILSGRLKDAHKEISKVGRDLSAIKSMLDVKNMEILAMRQIINSEIYLPQQMEWLYKKAVFHKKFKEFDEARKLLWEIIDKCPYRDISQRATEELRNMPMGELNGS